MHTATVHPRIAPTWNALRNRDLLGCFVNVLAKTEHPSKSNFSTRTNFVGNHSWEEGVRETSFSDWTAHIDWKPNFPVFQNIPPFQKIFSRSHHSHLILHFAHFHVSVPATPHIIISRLIHSSTALQICQLLLSCSAVSEHWFCITIKLLFPKFLLQFLAGHIHQPIPQCAWALSALPEPSWANHPTSIMLSNPPIAQTFHAKCAPHFDNHFFESYLMNF